MKKAMILLSIKIHKNPYKNPPNKSEITSDNWFTNKSMHLMHIKHNETSYEDWQKEYVQHRMPVWLCWIWNLKINNNSIQNPPNKSVITSDACKTKWNILWGLAKGMYSAPNICIIMLDWNLKIHNNLIQNPQKEYVQHWISVSLFWIWNLKININ